MDLKERDIWKKGLQTFLQRYDPVPPPNADAGSVARQLDSTPLPVIGGGSAAGEGEVRTYEALSRVAEELCKHLLKRSEILHQTSSRVKTYKSLKGKVYKEITTFIKKPLEPVVNEKRVFDILHEKIKDRAGVRILVYFPDDVSKVAKAINQSIVFEDKGAAISYTKSRIDHRKEDKEDQRESEPLNYSDGAFLSYSSVPTGTIIRDRWRHSGYRAAHLHIKLKADLKRQWDGGNIEGLNLKDLKAKFSKTCFEDLEPKLVEIQITTVVMHAWAQIEHDIIYKMPPGILTTGTMNRMLDGVNGLSITTEIMLEELARSEEHAKREFKQRERRGFSDYFELGSWLKHTYSTEMDELDWEQFPQWTQAVLEAFQLLDDECVSFNWTRDNLRNFIAAQRLLEASPSGHEKLDISLLILKALSLEYERAWPTKGLHKLLQVASSFSFMVAIEENVAVEMLKNRFSPEDVDKLRKINAIFTHSRLDNVDEKDLADFADRFLEANWCKTHDLAVALSRLHFLIAHRCEYVESSDRHKDIFCSEFQKHYGDVQAVVFCTGRWGPKAYGIDIIGSGVDHTSYFVPRLIKCGMPDRENDPEFEVVTREGEYNYFDEVSANESIIVGKTVNVYRSHAIKDIVRRAEEIVGWPKESRKSELYWTRYNGVHVVP